MKKYTGKIIIGTILLLLVTVALFVGYMTPKVLHPLGGTGRVIGFVAGPVLGN